VKLDKYKDIDKKLSKLSLEIKIIKALEAKNSQTEKEAFLSGEKKIPQFIYAELNYDTSKFGSELKDIRVGSDPIGKLYRDIITRLRIKNEILANIGNIRKVRTRSEKLYGRPDNRLVKDACKLLDSLINNQNKRKKRVKLYKPQEVKDILKNYLKKMEVKGWQVFVRNQHAVSVASLNRIIKISRFQKYTKKNIERLIQHEIKGHVFRALNGYLQPLLIFVSGLPGYLSTEEGIAIYLEEKSKLATISSKKRLALRVIAVDMVYKGADFRQTFDVINSYEKDQRKCWDIVYRVFRGGGFLKDHVYLKGYLEVKDYLYNGGKIEDLYFGKFSLDQLSLVKKLHSERVLKDPLYLP